MRLNPVFCGHCGTRVPRAAARCIDCGMGIRTVRVSAAHGGHASAKHEEPLRVRHAEPTTAD